MTSLRLGKLEPREDPRTLRLARYATLLLPRAPVAVRPPEIAWPMYANDRLGDCVWAGAGHEIQLWTREAGREADVSDADVIAAYSAVAGYRPDDPSTDQGTVVLDALNYRRKTGLAGHVIRAFVALDPRDHAHVRLGVALFGTVALGIRFPSSAMDQFNKNRPWIPVAGSGVEGGHYVPVVGYSSRYLDVVTWGRVQRMGWGFLDEYADEAYGLLSPEWRPPPGFDAAALDRDLAALGK